MVPVPAWCCLLQDLQAQPIPHSSISASLSSCTAYLAIGTGWYRFSSEKGVSPQRPVEEVGRDQEGIGIVFVPLMDKHLYGLPDYWACAR